VRWSRIRGPDPVVDQAGGALASAAQTPALVIDHRLAPEHPHPAALQDAMSAYLWLLDTQAAGIRIIVTGDSSGGGLAMSLLLALRERDLPLAAAAVLLCPWVDLDGRTQRPPQDSPILFTPELARRFADAGGAHHGVITGHG
jgi:epsilon-lactone hydrolase